MHTVVNGVADYAADGELEAIALAREIVGTWQAAAKTAIATQPVEEPYYDPS